MILVRHRIGRRRQREEPGKCLCISICLFLNSLNAFPFRRYIAIIAFIVSYCRRATVVVCQNDALVLKKNLKMTHFKSYVRHEIMSSSHIHVLLLSSAISFIVSITCALLSSFSVLVLKLSAIAVLQVALCNISSRRAYTVPPFVEIVWSNSWMP